MDASFPHKLLPKSPCVDHYGVLMEVSDAPLLNAGEKTPPAAPQYAISSSEDVVFYVGQLRKLYHVSAQSLTRGSTYFRNVLQQPVSSNASRGGRPPMILDCEESIFEKMLLLMRYGTLDALPAMAEAEVFKLKREADFYGIDYLAAVSPKNTNASSGHGEHGSSSSDMSSSSLSSSPSGSPKSMMNASNPLTQGSSRHMMSGRYYQGVRLACTTACQLSELPELPLDLSDPAKLVLVSCVDQDRAATYACEHCASSCAASRSVVATRVPTQWALNFHHRHAFCTACGNVPACKMPPRRFAEMFMAAAVHYYSTASPGPVKPDAGAANWWVGSDSTCMLRFVSSGTSGADFCSCAGEAPTSTAPTTIWAANCFYSHAFCTRCSQPAKGPTLLSILLALRYGMSKKGSKSARSSFRISPS